MTYNQKDYIGQSISSCLNQQVKPFEIIVLDDCSSDGTWEIVNSYQSLYPDLIKAFRNDVNRGIYYSYEKAKKLVSGNVVSGVAGDDFLLPNCIKDINTAILENDLNPAIDKFIIVTNYCQINKKEIYKHTNNYAIRNKAPIKLMLRQALSYRAVGMSKSLHDSVLNTFYLSILHPEWNYSIDSIKGLDEVIKASAIVFIDSYAGVQRLGVGVTSVCSAHQLPKVEINKFFEYILHQYSGYFDNNDLLFVRYLKYRMLLTINFNFVNFFIFIFYLIINCRNFEKNDSFPRQWRFLIPRWLLTRIKKYR
jgi:glycosyltransferase involved in cell wall biosynthesis